MNKKISKEGKYHLNYEPIIPLGISDESCKIVRNPSYFIIPLRLIFKSLVREFTLKGKY